METVRAILLVAISIPTFLVLYGKIRAAFDRKQKQKQKRKILSELLGTPAGRNRLAQIMIDKS